MSVSDLMTGLMIIFLFIAITYIRPFLDQNQKIETIVETWQNTELTIYEALNEEFESDLKRWNAELDDKTLTIRFNAPDVLFAPASSELKPEFEAILTEFFPRYLAVLHHFASQIEEIRIEGHTSSDWYGATTKEAAYFLNMELSQNRTRSVLEFSLSLPAAHDHVEWAKPLVTANGLSSSHLILHSDGNEDPARSRRVEFRVRTSSKEKLEEIINTLSDAR